MSKFEYINNSPKKKDTTDCVIRSFVTALGLDVRTVMVELTEYYLNTGYFINEPRCYDTYLRDKGYMKCKQLQKADKTKYTAEEFCDYLNTSTIQGPVIAHIGKEHVSTFMNDGTTVDKDYKLYDTWDCTDRCVGNYWIKT